MRERAMPVVFEMHDGRKPEFLSYEQVLKDRACGRRVVDQALHELDAWRRKFARLFEVLDFADWRGLIALLDQVRGGRPQRSAAHTRAKQDRRYVRQTFYRASAEIDAWHRTYGYLLERLKHRYGRKMAEAVGQVLHPEGYTVFYAWEADD